MTCPESSAYPNIDYITVEKHEAVEIPDEPFETVISATESTRIEAENYSNTGTASGNPVRTEDFTVDETDSTCLAFMNYAGNWVSYNVYAEEAGDYDVLFNVANGYDPFDWDLGIDVNGVAVENDIVSLEQTGDGSGEGEWYNFVDVGRSPSRWSRAITL